MKKGLMLSGMVVGCLLLLPAVAGAGGASFKERVQGRISSQGGQTMQYQPYYLESNFSAGDSVSDAIPARQSAMPPSVSSGRDGRTDRESLAHSNPNFIVYRVYYTGEIEENVVTVRGEVVFEVFPDAAGRPAEIPLMSNQVGLINVQVNKGKSFVMNRGNRYYLVVDKPGRYTLTTEYLVKAKREREYGPGNFRVDVMPAPISQFEFVIPEEDVQVFIEPAIKVETRTSDGKTEAWAVMPNTTAIDVRWTKALPKETIPRVELAPKMYAETWTYASIGGGVVQCRSRVQFSILQAEVSNFRVALPEDVSVLSVNSQEMRDWKVSRGDGVQYLDVFLNFGTKGAHVLDVAFERSVDEGLQVVSMPWVRALNVERESGFYGIAASTNLEIEAGSSERMTRIDSKQLPQYIWSQASMPILLAFKYLNHPISLDVEMTRHQEIPVLVAAIDAAHPETLVTKNGQVLTKLVFSVRNNVKQYLRIKLPETARVWSSFVDGQPVKPAKDKDGNVLIPLKKSQHGGSNVNQFPVEVVYLDEGNPVKGFGKLRMDLPAVDLPISQLNWRVYFPEEFVYFRAKSDGDVRSPYLRASSRSRRADGMFAGLAGSVQQTGMRSPSRTDDSVGDQYFMREIKQEELSAAAFDKGATHGTEGLLPVKIDLPLRGSAFTVSTLLVVEGAQPWISIQYFPWGRTARGWVLLIQIGLYFAAIVFLLKWLRLRRRRKIQKQE